MLQRDAGGDARAPIAAGREEAWVIQPGHQLAPGSGDAVDVPAGCAGSAAEGIAGQGRDHDVKRCFATRRISEQRGGLLELQERPGPAVGEHDRHGIRTPGTHVQEVDRQPVNDRPVLGNVVEPALGRAPVVGPSPVAAQVGDHIQGHPLRPIRDGLRLGPTRPHQALPQIVYLGLRDIDPKRFDAVEHLPFSYLLLSGAMRAIRRRRGAPCRPRRNPPGASDVFAAVRTASI